jgi:hypothetical protein
MHAGHGVSGSATNCTSLSHETAVSHTHSIRSSVGDNHGNANITAPAFYVLHPMHILARFIASHNTPRELLKGNPASYLTLGPNITTSSGPEFMFLKRSGA